MDDDRVLFIIKIKKFVFFYDPCEAYIFYQNRKSLMNFKRPKESHTTKKRLMIIKITKGFHKRTTEPIMILKTRVQNWINIFHKDK